MQSLYGKRSGHHKLCAEVVSTQEYAGAQRSDRAAGVDGQIACNLRNVELRVIRSVQSHQYSLCAWFEQRVTTDQECA